MSTAIAVLLCRHKCSVELLASKMAFHPPSPPSYTLETQDDGSLRIVFAHKEMSDALRLYGHRGGVQVEVHLLRTKRKQSIPMFHFICPGATTTILWSHANAMDCGEMYFFFVELAARLQVNLVAYDYSGYGAASGEPTESNAYADALAVYNFLEASGIDAERQVVLYGQSIGSAPTLYLATRRRVAATVLHTPILSGLRFLVPPSTGFCSVGGCCSPVCMYALCDPFPNIKRIRRVSAPVLIIHGTADRTVDCSASLILYERLPPKYRRARPRPTAAASIFLAEREPLTLLPCRPPSLARPPAHAPMSLCACRRAVHYRRGGPREHRRLRCRDILYPDARLLTLRDARGGARGAEPCRRRAGGGRRRTDDTPRAARCLGQGQPAPAAWRWHRLSFRVFRM